MPVQFVFGYKAAMIAGAALGGAGFAVYTHWEEIKFLWEHREDLAREAHAQFMEQKRKEEQRAEQGNDEFPSHEFDCDPEKVPDVSHFEIDSSLESCVDDDAASGHSSTWERVPERRGEHCYRHGEGGERRRHRHEWFGERSGRHHCCAEGRLRRRFGEYSERSERGGRHYKHKRHFHPDETEASGEHPSELSTDLSERRNRRRHRACASDRDSGSEGTEMRRRHGFTMPTPNSSGTLPSDRSRSASDASSNEFSEYSVIVGEFSD